MKDKRKTTVAIPLEIKREFHKICFDRELRDSEVIINLMLDFIKSEKNKHHREQTPDLKVGT